MVQGMAFGVILNEGCERKCLPSGSISIRKWPFLRAADFVVLSADQQGFGRLDPRQSRRRPSRANRGYRRIFVKSYATTSCVNLSPFDSVWQLACATQQAYSRRVWRPLFLKERTSLRQDKVSRSVGIGMGTAGTRLATDTCGQLRPLKFSTTF